LSIEKKKDKAVKFVLGTVLVLFVAAFSVCAVVGFSLKAKEEEPAPVQSESAAETESAQLPKTEMSLITAPVTTEKAPEVTVTIPKESPVPEQKQGYTLNFGEKYKNKSYIELYLQELTDNGYDHSNNLCAHKTGDIAICLKLTEEDKPSVSVVCGELPKLSNKRMNTLECELIDEHGDYWTLYSTVDRQYKYGDGWGYYLVLDDSIYEQDEKSCIYIYANALDVSETCNKENITTEKFFADLLKRLVKQAHPKREAFLIEEGE
jgi:hypothetical protein